MELVKVGVDTKTKNKKTWICRRKKVELDESSNAESEEEDDDNDKGYTTPHTYGHVEIAGSFDMLVQLNRNMATAFVTFCKDIEQM